MVFGQAIEKASNYRKNDILLDPFWLIGGLAINASYERILSEDSGVGLNTIIGIGESLDDFSQISPYYRTYFGSRYASGFFIEGFMPIVFIGEYDSNESGTESNFQTKTSGGLGFGLGAKWVARRKFVFELNIGVGRQLVGRFANSNRVTGKGMIGVGFAF